MPKPIKTDYPPDELVRVSMEFLGSDRNMLAKIAIRRELTLIELIYGLLKSGLLAQGYTREAEELSSLPLGRNIGARARYQDDDE